ncbi:hypothetical protein AVEN_38282-1 [Araneus ventricosus]|uniref:Uncharacterized protein n=1 Tax=Araneus ventricosus TaxID=182803 RepID=A0A4Y2E4I4_ARAVE|nr:hypothetical protein AVEN_38282-1 [Araneus ventricosus]
MRLKLSDGDSGTSQDPTWFDTPPDGSCLFWSVTLAYLVPVKGDENGFKQRHVESLFLIQNQNVPPVSSIRSFATD